MQFRTRARGTLHPSKQGPIFPRRLSTGDLSEDLNLQAEAIFHNSNNHSHRSVPNHRPFKKRIENYNDLHACADHNHSCKYHFIASVGDENDASFLDFCMINEAVVFSLPEVLSD